MPRPFLLLAAAAVGATGAHATVRARDDSARAAAHAAAAAEVRVRRADIAFFEQRAARDPYGAADRARLAALHLAEARATGHPDALARAEAAARASLRIRAGRNDAASLALASALMGQHRFAEALDVATSMEAGSPGDPRRAALTGEVLLELGRYREAAARFGAVGPGGDLSMRLRLARWRELTGDVDGAWALALGARDESSRLPALPREQRAWFELRVADLGTRYGRLEEADRALERAERLLPGDARVALASARLALARGDGRGAAAHAERALADGADPSALAVLWRARVAAGDPRGAAEALDALAAVVRSQPAPWHRDWSLALLDGGREVPLVLAQSGADLAARRDVYGLDLHAWALHRSGRHEEARAMARESLAHGLRDPAVLARARTIEAAAR